MMPALFVGHGSPMNAVETNDFTQALSRLGKSLPQPSAILCVSAHWLTQGAWVTKMENPKTIHDFYGFPEKLFNVQYPAPGSIATADKVFDIIKSVNVKHDTQSWGLDHGTWSVLVHMYPEANIPVLQLSIDLSRPPEYHYKIGQELRTLRDQGVLILGSGNIVHNLRKIKWEANATPFEWASEYDEWIKNKLLKHDENALMKDYLSSPAAQLSVPSNDHYYPLLYVLGSSQHKDEVRFEYEGIQNGSISMRTVCFG